MNRYDLKEVDCILAMSGGMDCVVLLHWLLERDRKPLIFFKAEQSNGPYNDYIEHQLQKIKQYYKVPMITWEINPKSSNNGFFHRQKTKDWYKNFSQNNFIGKDKKDRKGAVQANIPGINHWQHLAMIINTMHPWITEIYWGMCYGGLLVRNDLKGDSLWDYNEDGELVWRNWTLNEPMNKSNYDGRHQDLFLGALASLSHVGIQSEFISPLGHYSKKELYEMLPKEVREMIVTCNAPWRNAIKEGNKVMKECGQCHKCRDLIEVRKACGEL